MLRAAEAASSEGPTGGKLRAVVTAPRDAGANLNRNLSGALPLETLKFIAEARGQNWPTAAAMVDRALSEAGYSRSQRRQLIADLRADPSETTERSAT
jgi:hypothetical protein